MTVERTTRTTTRTTHPNGNTATSTRTDASYTFTKINWIRTKHEDGSVSHHGTRAGWTFHIHTPRGPYGGSTVTGVHEDGREFRYGHATTTQAKEACLFEMRPDEAMAWQADRNFENTKVAAWGKYAFNYFSYALRIDDIETGTSTFHDVDGFAEAKAMAREVLAAAYGAPAAPVRPEGPAAVAEALTKALTAADIKATPKQLATAAAMLATELHAAPF